MECEAFNGVCAARLDRDQLAELARLTQQGIGRFKDVRLPWDVQRAHATMPKRQRT